jgi:response regulator RpfG family c-di-GMP phosphodiesterase
MRIKTTIEATNTAIRRDDTMAQIGRGAAMLEMSTERPSDAIVVDARLPFQDVVEQIVNALKAKPSL